MSDPTIGIIGGTGKEGRGIAIRLGGAGFRVAIGSREPERARETAAELAAAGIEAMGDANAEVVAASDINVLSVPFRHAVATISSLHDAFRSDSLLLDVTVPVAFAAGQVGYEELPDGSAAETLRKHLREDVGLAAALKTLPAALLAKPERDLDCDTFVCGDSDAARARTMELLARVPGLRPIDVGDLRSARTLERMTVLLIGINRRYKTHDGRFRVLGLPAS